MGMLHENTDCKNEFFGEEDQEINITMRVKYVGYHREKTHLVRPILQKEVMGLDPHQDMLVHESVISEIAQSAEIPHQSIASVEAQKPHKSLFPHEAANHPSNDVQENQGQMAVL